MKRKTDSHLLCPCGSGRDYIDCCQPYIDGEKFAPTAEALMRSRYSAYINEEVGYLLASWHVSTRPENLDLQMDKPDSWLGLKIASTAAGLETDNNGEVEFTARYKLNGRAFRLHERSRFVKEEGRWFYVDGVMLD